MLGWIDRHRVLDVLRTDLDTVKLVDWKLNLARDLYQVSEAPEPCREFAKALDAIAESKDPYFVEHLFNDKLAPPEPSSDNEEDAAACDGLDARLTVVRDLMRAAHPDEAAEHEAPSKKKKKRKRKKK
jgi:hypothetical protein